MAIQNFSDLKSAISNWLARSDLDLYLNDIVLLGEKRLQRDLRIREIEETFSDTMSSGELDVPTSGGQITFNSLKHARLDVSGGHPLEIAEADWIYKKFPCRESTGRPNFIAVDADKFIFGQFPDANYDVKGTIYKRPLLLSDSNTTNEWIDEVPDALLMACLAESAPFLKDDQRMQIWEVKYNQIKEGYNTDYKRQTRQRTRVRYDSQ
jgi:hypothetical protein